MRAMRVKFLKTAQLDLLNCGDYYREIGGARLARTMLDRIKGPILTLGDHPELAPAYEAAPGVRRLVVVGGLFLVFYRIQVDVEVLHVRRAERAPVLDQTLREMIEDGRM